MSASYDYDIIIVGGGLSGLTMALTMQNTPSLAKQSILILEKRSQYEHDRSWCGWAVRPHAFQDCVAHSWHAWTVARQGQRVVQRAARIPYQYIPAGRFYETCLARIAKSKTIDLKLDVSVSALAPHSVESSMGTVTAKTVFDARPADFQSLELKNYLLQCFHGWHIETDKAIFDPNTVTLMDFPDDQSNGCHFLYVLPFSETEALIEPTYFLHHQSIPDKTHFESLMQQYLAEHYHCHDWQVKGTEQGVLPMMRFPKSLQQSAVMAIGTNAGLLRPATGYAFFAVMRYCEALCKQYDQFAYFKNTDAFSKRSAWMDEIFLKVCRAMPAQAADIFFSMFQHTDGTTIAHFMQDEASLRDLLSVIMSVPTSPFLKAACGLQP